jgi:hypothetical protein
MKVSSMDAIILGGPEFRERGTAESKCSKLSSTINSGVEV